jgi:superkiller protein 3
VLSARQSRIYASSVSLWTDTIAKNPNAWLAHTNLGADFDDQGKILEAASEYETSLRINPNDAKARNNLAIHLAELGRLPEAVEEWERALQFEPDNVSSHMNVAFALSQLGRFPEAFQHWERAIKLKPDLIDAHHSFGVALAQSGRWNEAIEQFMETTRLKPDYADAHYRLAVALKNAGRYDEAIARYRKTVELETHATAQNALAWILATCPKSSLRNGKEAVEWAEQAVERTRGQYPQTLDTLAAAYAEVGEFERAIKTARSALDLQAARENPVLKDAIELRLKLYENRTPYHEN